MSLLDTLSFIVNHPIGKRNRLKYISRFVSFQISQRLFSGPIKYQFTTRSKLLIKRHMWGATGNIYTGLHEFEDMGFVLHYLRPHDLFIDIGANVGTYTVLASGHVGCQTISIEPLPDTFEHLKKNIELNAIENKVRLINKAAGSSQGKVRFTSHLDTMNHVAIEGETEDVVEVEVDKLDRILNSDEQPEMIKIDVEGFETEVLEGALETLRKKTLNVILIELNGSGKKYGYEDTGIHTQLLSSGFLPYQYNPLTRHIKLIKEFGNFNTIYIRDIDRAMKRLKEADMVWIGKLSF